MSQEQREKISQNRNGVTIFVMNEAGQIILGKRKGGYREGEYGAPGGRIEPGETEVEAAHRELLSETGIDIKVRDLIFIGKVTDFQDGPDRPPFIHNTFLVYSSEKSQLIEGDKCEGWEQYDLAEIPTNTLRSHHCGVRGLIAYLKTKSQFSYTIV